jgi:hypothetical protein
MMKEGKEEVKGKKSLLPLIIEYMDRWMDE